MAVSKKEKKLLEGMWGEAEDMPESSLPDGKFQFKIIGAEFGLSNSDKPRMASEYEVVGGDEDYLGETVTVYDNLETSENMSWFKRKISRLGLEIPESFDDITDGTLAKEMIGCKFEGQCKTKDGFFNVYVNKPLDNDDNSELEGTDEEEYREDSGEETIEVGDTVTFNEDGEIYEGTVKTINEDDEQADVVVDDDEWTVDLSELSIVYEGDDGDEEEGKEEGADDKFPSAKAIGKMKKKELTELLEKVGLDYDDIDEPKEVMATIAMVAADEACSKAALVEACKAFGRKIKKSDDVKKLTKNLKAEIDAAIME